MSQNALSNRPLQFIDFPNTRHPVPVLWEKERLIFISFASYLGYMSGDTKEARNVQKSVDRSCISKQT
jgi:hypothetical protein